MSRELSARNRAVVAEPATEPPLSRGGHPGRTGTGRQHDRRTDARTRTREDGERRPGPHQPALAGNNAVYSWRCRMRLLQGAAPMRIPFSTIPDAIPEEMPRRGVRHGSVARTTATTSFGCNANASSRYWRSRRIARRNRSASRTNHRARAAGRHGRMLPRQPNTLANEPVLSTGEPGRALKGTAPSPPVDGGPLLSKRPWR